MIVLLGSTRPAKVEGARDALALIAAVDGRFAHAEIHPVDLTSIAPSMPLTAEDIVDGARRRARALVGTVDADDIYAVGLEGGLSPVAIAGLEYWTLQTWAAVTDGTRWGYGGGGALTLPDSIVQRVLAGEELGDVIDEIAGEPTRGHRGAWGVLTRDLVGRRDAFRLAVLAAFAPFYNPAPWS